MQTNDDKAAGLAISAVRMRNCSSNEADESSSHADRPFGWTVQRARYTRPWMAAAMLAPLRFRSRTGWALATRGMNAVSYDTARG